MVNLKEEPFDYRPNPKQVVHLLRFIWRFRKHPEALDTYLDEVKEAGIPATNLANVHIIMTGWRQAYLKRLDLAYKIDTYFLAGLGALDLVLIPLIVAIGVPDRAMFIALLSLAVSLVLVGWSLFITFVKRTFGQAAYGRLHGTLNFLAGVSGPVALGAAIWHDSPVISIVYFGLATVASLAGSAYMTVMLVGKEVVEALLAASASETATSAESHDPAPIPT